ncbi:MAG: hypothetical protein Q7R58_02740 [bacterium]|nr:hypothetical protein [bacterium]
MRDRLLIIVRHGEYESGDNSPLSETGREQMKCLRRVINAFVAKTFGREETTRLCFSFSGSLRAVESIQKLRLYDEDIVMNELYVTNPNDAGKPAEILEKVLGLANHYGANVVVIVAHSTMPTVIAGAAHKFVTGRGVSGLSYAVKTGHGFVVKMATGAVSPIGWDDSPDEELPLAQESNRPVIKAPPRSGQVVFKGGPNDLEGDERIPFV